jgi:two-component system, NarL family, sensor histidine kinase UhpB
MKNISVIFLLNFFTLIISSQMQAQTAYTKADSTAVYSLIDRAEDYFQKSNYDSALANTARAIGMSRSKKFLRGEAMALIKTNDILIERDRSGKTTENSQIVYKIGIRLKDSLITAISFLQMGQAKMYMDEPDTAIMLIDKSLVYKLSRLQGEYTALAYNDLGYTWGQKDEYEKQADFTVKSLKIYEMLRNDAGTAMALGNLSTVYYSMGQKDKAIEYGKRGLEYRQKTGDIEKISLTCCNLSQYYIGLNTDEAEKYRQLCVKYAQQSGIEDRMIHSYITSSLVANSKKNNKEAMEYELKVIELLEKSKSNPRMLARRYIAAAIYNDILKLDSVTTLSYYDKSIRIASELNDRSNLKDVYLYLSNYYSRRKNYQEAYNSFKKHILYKDSIINADKDEMLAEIEARYKTEIKDNEISRLNADQKIKQLQIEKQKALLAGNLLEAQKKENEIELLSKAKELQELKITQQDEQLEKQILQAKTNEQQLQLAEKEKQLQERKLKNSGTVRNFILAGIGLLALLGYFLFNRYQLKRKIQQQDALLSVRNNIAQDLHDEIGSTLTSIKILSEVSEKNLYKDRLKTSSFLQKITEQSTAVQQGISDIVWSVKPENDTLEKMVIRMREYAAHTLESKNIQTVINIDEQVLNKTLDMGRRRDFFLIFKEAINNIAKYADATEVRVALEKNNDKLRMVISDNGKGFDVSRQTSSSGLKNMQARAAALNGLLDIQSTYGKGSEIILTIPAT